MGNRSSTNNAPTSGVGDDGDDDQHNTQSLPTDTTLPNNPNNDNAATNGIHAADSDDDPSEYSDDYINDDTEYAFTTSAPPTPQSSADKITKMLASHGVISPRPFQLDAIFQLCIRRVSMLYLIRKTGEGKSLVLKGMATIKRGITLCLVPLVGLGSDQAIKTTCAACGLEAYHVDEWKGDRCNTLMDRLTMFDPSKQHKSILLFISPRELINGTRWCNLINDLAKKGSISALCVDEVHAVVEDHDSFRPEFKSAIVSIANILETARIHRADKHVPLLVMSATFRRREQKSFANLIKMKPALVMWGAMDRRNINIEVTINGNSTSGLEDTLKRLLSKEKTGEGQFIINTNSATAAETRLYDLVDSLLDGANNHSTRDVVSLTGNMGIMYKAFLMNSFCNNDANEYDNFPNIAVMTCTAAANCGVSSPNCIVALRHGSASTIEDFYQELGRVDREYKTASNLCGYYIHLDFRSIIAKFAQIFAESNASVRNRKERNFLRVLHMTLLPTQCYHTAMEKYLENPKTFVNQGGCGRCPYCSGSYKQFTDAIDRKFVASTVQVKLATQREPVLALDVVKFLTDATNRNEMKRRIWGENGISKPPGKVHALALQLLAAGFLQLYVNDESKLGRDGLSLNDIHVQMGTVLQQDVDGNIVEECAINHHPLWEPFNYDRQRWETSTTS